MHDVELGIKWASRESKLSFIAEMIWCRCVRDGAGETDGLIEQE